MDGPGLSGRELRILAEIEAGLRVDHRPERALRGMRHGPRWVVGRVLRWAARVPVFVFPVLAALSTTLLLVSATVYSAAVIAGFSVVWGLSIALGAARLVAHRRGIVP
ncbi:hypothetical protein ACIRYZ_31120 [Kitasatospora sp. NPDC101155]|uniref:hypothetical protein n=1 Tax=Kitasatospora sp. NPDC101155 TaxID=3364097 RepID=UPI00382316A6